MSYSELISVKIDGTFHHYWTNATIARSIERGAHSFSLSLTDSSDSDALSTPTSIEVGMSVEVYISNDLVISGYIDDLSTSYDATSHSLTVNGRSKIGDLIDCSIEGQQFLIGQQNLQQIAESLCEPFGITVSVDDSAKTAAAETFTTDHNLDIGQPIWEFLEELARLKAVFLVSDSNGNLLITRAGSTTASVSLELGKNIKTGSGSFSQRQLFKTYTVCGQVATNESNNQGSAVSTQYKASVNGTDTSMRYRPFTVFSDNQADNSACETRAKWQRNVNESRAQSLQYTVQGWRQKPDGDLWQANQLVHVTDSWIGVDKKFLIVETRMQFGSSGSTTELHLMPEGAFSINSDSTA